MRVVSGTALGLLIVLSGCAGNAPANDGGPVAAGATLVLTDSAGDADAPVDVLGATLSETPESLVVEIEIANLPQDFGASAFSGYSWVWWDVCWQFATNESESSDDDQCAGLTVENSGGVADVRAHYGIYLEDGCNDWEWCEWSVPYEVTAGTPGKVKITVPRALLVAGEQGDILTKPTLEASGGSSSGPAAASGIPSAYVYAYGPGVGPRSFRLPPSTFASIKDESKVEADFTFLTPRADASLSTGLAIMADAAGDVADARGIRRDLDITGVALEETATTLSWRISVGEIGPAPTHQFYASLGIGPRVLEAWYDVQAGVVTEPGGGYCTDGCDDYVDYPITVSFQAGTPGIVGIDIARADLPPEIAGQVVNLADFYIWEGAFASSGQAGVGLPVFALARAWGAGDWAWGAEPVIYGMTA